MLVLSRKINEQILIPELNITLTILSVGKNRVQIGIDAPAEIRITRPEATRAIDGTVRDCSTTAMTEVPHPERLTRSLA